MGSGRAVSHLAKGEGQDRWLSSHLIVRICDRFLADDLAVVGWAFRRRRNADGGQEDGKSRRYAGAVRLQTGQFPEACGIQVRSDDVRF